MNGALRLLIALVGAYVTLRLLILALGLFGAVGPIELLLLGGIAGVVGVWLYRRTGRRAHTSR